MEKLNLVESGKTYNCSSNTLFSKLYENGSWVMGYCKDYLYDFNSIDRLEKTEKPYKIAIFYKGKTGTWLFNYESENEETFNLYLENGTAVYCIVEKLENNSYNYTEHMVKPERLFEK